MRLFKIYDLFGKQDIAIFFFHDSRGTHRFSTLPAERVLNINIKTRATVAIFLLFILVAANSRSTRTHGDANLVNPDAQLSHPTAENQKQTNSKSIQKPYRNRPATIIFSSFFATARAALARTETQIS